MSDKAINISWGVVLGLALIIAIVMIVMRIYALVTYGDTPITEAPVWVVWILADKWGN